MPNYLVQVAYESAAVAALVKKPQDRLGVVSKVIQKLGGTLIGGWLCFGGGAHGSLRTSATVDLDAAGESSLPAFS